MAVSKATILSDIFGLFYDRLVANVTSVTLADATTSTIATYTSAFPDKALDEKGDYPILVVNSPNIEWSDFNMGHKWASGNIDIDIYTSKAESAEKFADAINNSLETYRGTLRTNGLQFVKLDGVKTDDFFRGAIKVHVKTATFSFKFMYTPTVAGVY